MVISSSHILFFSLLLLSPLMVVSHFWTIFTYRHIYIRNDLENGTFLTIHCTGQHKDFGVQKLNYKEEFKFQFKINFWVDPTLYFCGLTWDRKLHILKAFDEHRDVTFCKDLKWSVTKYQTCLFNCDTQQYVKCERHDY
ncbi:putative plant self-incompatibility S1 [Lupinus albus]|uniref:S-protein homolog n=1 Tax=Lupinus albus TaxID=3870 RepID=A0A6A4PHE2_LUPAL|nr:putative plant self-incompatibility S1 [Lupinus albus]